MEVHQIFKDSFFKYIEEIPNLSTNLYNVLCKELTLHYGLTCKKCDVSVLKSREQRLYWPQYPDSQQYRGELLLK